MLNLRCCLKYLLFLTCLFYVCPAFAQDSSLVNDDASVSRMLSEAQKCYEQRPKMDSLAEAAVIYEEILKKDPGNLQAAQSLTITYIWLGANASDAEDEDLLEKAVEAGEVYLQLSPDNDFTAIYLMGLTNVLYGQANGGLGALPYLCDFKEQMQWCLKQDPAFDYGGPHRALGCFYAKAPGLVGGDKKKAEEHLLEALKLGPNYHLNHLYLAQLYMDTGRPEMAQRLLEQVINGEPLPDLEPEYEIWRAKAERLIIPAIQQAQKN